MHDAALQAVGGWRSDDGALDTADNRRGGACLISSGGPGCGVPCTRR